MSAKYNPERRSATAPSTTAWMAPTSAATTRPIQNSCCRSVTTYAEVNEPNPTKA
jgi:hypothetical protein